MKSKLLTTSPLFVPELFIITVHVKAFVRQFSVNSFKYLYNQPFIKGYP
jgi:hypothetical protein